MISIFNCQPLGSRAAANQSLALTIAGYNAVSRFLLAMDVAEMKDVKVGDARLPAAKL